MTLHFGVYESVSRLPFNRTRCGGTLVELLIGVLILCIVALGWVRMSNIQAVRKESLRYAAVEKAAGIMDLMTTKFEKNVAVSSKGENYHFDGDNPIPVKWKLPDDNPSGVFPLWPDEEWEGAPNPIGCSIFVSATSGPSAWTNGVWCRISLWDSREVRLGEKPFASFECLLRRKQVRNP